MRPDNFPLQLFVEGHHARRHAERQIARMGIETIRSTNRAQPWVLGFVGGMVALVAPIWMGWL